MKTSYPATMTAALAATWLGFLMSGGCSKPPTDSPDAATPVAAPMAARSMLPSRHRPTASALPPVRADLRSPEQIASAACAASDGSWRCDVARPHLFAAGTTPTIPVSWTVPAWFINPVTGHDNRACTTALTACKTYKEIAVHRWGTYEPQLQQMTTMTFLDDQPDVSDPVIATPFLGQGAGFYLVGTPKTLGAAALNIVTPKSRPAGVTLSSTITGVIPAAAQGSLVENMTHPSFAWVDDNTAGVLTFTQPMASNTPAAPAAYSPAPAEVDSWAPGDSITFLAPTQVYVADFRPIVQGSNGASQGIFAYIAHIWVPDPRPIGSSQYHLNNESLSSESRFDPWVSSGTTDTNNGSINGFVNCWNPGGGVYSFNAVVGGALNTLAGIGALLQGATLDGDAIVHGADISPGASAQILTEMGLVNAYGNWTVGGRVSLSPSLYLGHSMWGTYTYDMEGNGTRYTGSAVASFQGAPTLELLTGSTGHSIFTGAGHVDTACGGIALTPGNLDIAASANCATTGFGGLAFIPGSVTITNLGI
jgi:hypothetical protein